MIAPDFWNHSAKQSRAVRMLAPLGRIYGKIVQKRAASFPRYRASVPVICVGNVVMGGSGKTPVVQAVLRQLHEGGHKPAVLMRGYGGAIKKPAWVDVQKGAAALYGDEAMLHARMAPVVVSPDRVAGAQLIEQDKTITHIVMDDGFQNAALHKDICLLVVDGKNPVGNGHVFPAGPLRETLDDGLKRAHALVILGEDVQHLQTRYQFMLPVLHGALKAENGADIAGKPVVAFAGIGYPQKFFDTVRICDAVLVETKAFPDHHAFKNDEIDALLKRAVSVGAMVVTTRKDWVRLPQALQEKVHVLDVRLKWNDPQLLQDILRKTDSNLYTAVG